MGRVTALADNSSLGPLGAICVHDDLGAVGLVVVLALFALAAGEYLCANTDSLANLDVCDFGSDFDRRANNFYTDEI